MNRGRNIPDWGQLRKSLASVNLSTVNPIWTSKKYNPGMRGARPATNRFSPGTSTRYPITLYRNVVRKKMCT